MSDNSSLSTQDLDLQRTLCAVCEAAVKLVNVDHSGLVIFSESRETGTVVAEYGALITTLELPIQVAGIEPAEKLVTERQPIVSNDVANDSSLGALRPHLLSLNIKSIVIVPIVVDNEVIGSFSFDVITAPRVFEEWDVRECKALAEFASLALKNAYLASNLESLRKAILAVTAKEDRLSIYSAITKEAVGLLKTKGGGIDQLDVMHNELVVVAPHNMPEELAGKRFRVGEGLSGRIIKEKLSSLAITDYQRWPDRAPAFYDTHVLESMLGVPLVWRDEWIGVLWVTDSIGREYRAADIDLLQRLAVPASVAIAQDILRESLRVRANRFKSLSLATTAILSHMTGADRQERLSAIAKHATLVANAETCGVLLVEDPDYLTLVASYGHREFQKGKKIRIQSGATGTGLTGHIAHSKRVFRECGSNLRDHFAVKDKTGGSDYSPSGECFSLLAIPLIRNQQVRGLIRISNKKDDKGKAGNQICFDREDEVVGSIFAQAALAVIETADLIEDVTGKSSLYAQLLETWNTLASEEPLEIRLEKIARNVVQITRKSFCRILLSEGVEDFLTVGAAAVHPRSSGDASLSWGENTSRTVDMTGWPEVANALNAGRPFELRSSDPFERRILERATEMLDLRDSVSKERLPVSFLFSIPMIVGARRVGLLSLGEVRGWENRRQELRGRDRRTELRPGFTPDQKNVATAIAAQATVMIDREWRTRLVNRRAQLFSRSSRALDIIRAEKNSNKKLEVITEQTRFVFGVDVCGLIAQATPEGAPLFVCSSSNGTVRMDPLDSSLPQLGEVMASATNSKTLSNRFANIYPELPICVEGQFSVCLAVRFDYAATSRCLLFIGDVVQPSELGLADLGVLEEFGTHCAMSLTRAAMREQLTNARDGVNQIAIDLALGDQLQALRNVVRGIRMIMKCDAVTLYTIRTVDLEIKAPPATTGLFDEHKPTLYIRPVMDSPVGRVLTKNELHVAADVEHDAVMHGGFIVREQIKSSAGIPVWLPEDKETTPRSSKSSGAQAKKIAVGVLFVNYRQPHTFDKDDERNIKMAAQLAAVAIRNHSLFSEERRKATILTSLYEASKALSGTLDLVQILQHVAEQSYRLAHLLDRQVTHVAAKLFQDNRAIVHATYPSLTASGINVGQSIDLDPATQRRGIVGRAYELRASQIVQDVSKDPDYVTIFHDTKSQMVVLIGEEKCPAETPIGAISVESPDYYAFDATDLAAFRALAALANDALKNAQEFLDRQYALDREANLKDLALYYIKCGILIHNQKAPVTAIKERAITLLQTLGDETNGTQAQKIAASIVKDSENLEAISSQADPSAIQLVTVDLIDLARDWNKRLFANPQLLNVSKFVLGPEETGHRIEIDELLMRHLLKVFVDNSIRAMQGKEEKFIRINIKAGPESSCKICIRDSGKGISPQLWRIISAGKRPESGVESRKGLRTALLIITGFGGKIDLLNSSAAGTEFEILLPLVT